jgi:APA family basic amino acid/polyamine antiporter
MWQRLFHTKNISSEVPDSDRPLMRVLGPIDLTMLGIGGIVGAGVFALIGEAVAGKAGRLGAGPALVVSLIFTAIACGFAGLCYAEFASVSRVAGSAYSYAYATLGELLAWIIGWDLVLEYAVGNVAVAIPWSGYFQVLINPFLRRLHERFPWIIAEFPKWLGTDLPSAAADANKGQFETIVSAPHVFGVPIVFNLLAVLIVAFITVLLFVGIKESARFNTLMVAIKLIVLAIFVIIGASHIKAQNLTPFMPTGWPGVQAGAAVIFFAFIGFDAVSTAAEECRNPRRDLPIGILGSLVICTLLYMLVAFVLTGMTPWQRLCVDDPLSYAMLSVGENWVAGLIAFGAVVATTAVLLVFQLGQTRILYAMSRDRLLPAVLAKTHSRFHTPHVATILTGLFVGIGAALSSMDVVVDLCNIGTLFAFVIVCAGVLVLRWRDLARNDEFRNARGAARLGRLLWWRDANPEVGFRAPLVPWVPLLGIASCAWLMLGLGWTAWIRFGVWLLVGLGLYFCFGYWTKKETNGRDVQS